MAGFARLPMPMDATIPWQGHPSEWVARNIWPQVRDDAVGRIYDPDTDPGWAPYASPPQYTGFAGTGFADYLRSHYLPAQRRSAPSLSDLLMWWRGQ